MKKIKMINKFPQRLLNFWDRHLIGADVSLIMQNIVIIVKTLMKNDDNFNKNLIEELEKIRVNSFWVSNFQVEKPLQILEIIFCKFYDLYWSLKEKRSNPLVEEVISKIVRDFRQTLFYGNLGHIFSVPKNHFLEEICADRKVHGPCEYFETSYSESTHHIHRTSGSSKNNRFLSSNIVIAQAERMLLSHLVEGGILFEDQEVREGIFSLFSPTSLTILHLFKKKYQKRKSIYENRSIDWSKIRMDSIRSYCFFE